MKKRLPMGWDQSDLDEIVARFSDAHPKLYEAAEAILAEYSVSRRMYHELARVWMMELIDRHRRPEAYAEKEEEDDPELLAALEAQMRERRIV
jgi:hypothetical protein